MIRVPFDNNNNYYLFSLSFLTCITYFPILTYLYFQFKESWVEIGQN